MECNDEEIVRIVKCINSCWPEYPFTYEDIRKPTGEKFGEILFMFLQEFFGRNYKLPNLEQHIKSVSSTPEMFTHLEGTISLFRSINSILKRVNYRDFKYGTMVKPTSNAVKDVLLVLVNLLAYMEAERPKKKKIELEDAEEVKIREEEVRQMREKYMKFASNFTKIESDVDDLTKRMQITNVSLEKASITLKQVEQEKERAAEAVVANPEGLKTELARSQYEKEAMEANFLSVASRLPHLDQQIQKRALQLQEGKETHQRLAHVKTRESKIKLELRNIETDVRRVEEEKDFLGNNLKTEQSLIDSKKRMLVELEQYVDHLSEKARSDVKRGLEKNKSREAHIKARFLAVEEEISQLKRDLELGQKTLDEGAAKLKAIHLKHQQDMEQISAKMNQRGKKKEK
uniref:Kinetochore protein Nuf2 N-terminal domain-containing protein n=1 Tax=Daphnia galeata TaxID=27404 RepID=A0A8J2RLJ6_9CRUS|nr:unnamed protein product [Daphnia galeata]